MIDLDNCIDQRTRTAVHEAAHVVVAVLLYERIEYVTIKPDERNLGHVRSRPFLITDRDVWRCLLSTCAGNTAEERLGNDVDAEFENRYYVEGEEYTDAGRINRFLSMLSIDPTPHESLLCEAENRVRKLFRNPAVWRAVEHLATKLLERETLDEEKASEIIMTALRRSVWERNRFRKSEEMLAVPEFGQILAEQLFSVRMMLEAHAARCNSI